MNDRTEEEQIEAIKTWWKENGVAVITGIVVGIAVIGGVRFWSYYQDTQAKAASVIYQQVEQALTASNDEEVLTQGKKLVSDYAGTSYASLAALAMARTLVSQDKLDEARQHLEWVVNNAGDTNMQHLARLRLARVMLAQDKANDVLSLITTQSDSAYAASYADLKGDAHLSLGNNQQAVDAYDEALQAGNLQPEQQKLIEMKRNSIALEN